MMKAATIRVPKITARRGVLRVFEQLLVQFGLMLADSGMSFEFRPLDPDANGSGLFGFG
jgi:hypothetical protein